MSLRSQDWNNFCASFSTEITAQAQKDFIFFCFVFVAGGETLQNF